MNDKMCPILTIGEYRNEHQGLVGCFGDKCAMWNEHLACCGLIAKVEPRVEIVPRALGVTARGNRKC